MKRLFASLMLAGLVAAGTASAGDRIFGSSSYTLTLGGSQQVSVIAPASNVHGLWVRSANAIIYASGGDLTVYANNPNDQNTVARSILYLASPCCGTADPNVTATINDSFYLPPGTGLSVSSSAPNGFLRLTYDLAQ